jgi:hypothetical protein
MNGAARTAGAAPPQLLRELAGNRRHCFYKRTILNDSGLRI